MRVGKYFYAGLIILLCAASLVLFGFRWHVPVEDFFGQPYSIGEDGKVKIDGHEPSSEAHVMQQEDGQQFVQSSEELDIRGTKKRILSVYGEGIARSKPDFGVLKINITAKGKTSYEALQNNNWVQERMLRFLKNRKISKDQVSTEGFKLYKEEEGFVLKNDLSLRVDVVDIGKLIDGLITAGVSSIKAIEFGIEDYELLLKESIKKAVLNAQSKAEALLTPLEMELGNVESVKVIEVQKVPADIGSAYQITGEGYMKGCIILPKEIVIKTRIETRFEY